MDVRVMSIHEKCNNNAMCDRRECEAWKGWFTKNTRANNFKYDLRNNSEKRKRLGLALDADEMSYLNELRESSRSNEIRSMMGLNTTYWIGSAGMDRRIHPKSQSSSQISPSLS